MLENSQQVTPMRTSKPNHLLLHRLEMLNTTWKQFYFKKEILHINLLVLVTAINVWYNIHNRHQQQAPQFQQCNASQEQFILRLQPHQVNHLSDDTLTSWPKLGFMYMSRLPTPIAEINQGWMRTYTCERYNAAKLDCCNFPTLRTSRIINYLVTPQTNLTELFPSSDAIRATW